MKFTYQGNEYKLILFTIAGSRFYGTHYEKGEHPFKPEYVSDTDYRGIFIAHPDTKIGMTDSISSIEVKKDIDGNVPSEQQELIKELNKQLGLDMAMDEDLNLYEIKKFVTMALENNPNIMDIIYTDDEAVIYENDKGKKLRSEGKDIFMSTKTKFTFSGYAMGQLKRIKGHNKWIAKYPKTGIVFRDLTDAYNVGDIDYNWITDYFGGKVSEYVTGVKQQDANKLGKVQSISWDDFVEKYSNDSDDNLSTNEWFDYRKPQMIDYCFAKDLMAKKYPLDTTEPYEISPNNISTRSVTLKEFLLEEASFRSVSKTMYNIFTPSDKKFNGGIFSRSGKLKSKDPEEVGTFVCQLSIDEMNYKKDLDNIQKLWEWRTGRNEKRSVLEEHFGYDTKHMSHTIRLLIGGYNILTTGEYHPRLSDDNLKFVRDVLNGEHTYDYLLDYATKLEKKLDVAYNNSKLPKSPNHKKANALLLELSRDF